MKQTAITTNESDNLIKDKSLYWWTNLPQTEMVRLRNKYFPNRGALRSEERLFIYKSEHTESAPISKEVEGFTELKLVRWAKDKYPPIDLNEQVPELLKLLASHQQQAKDIEELFQMVKDLKSCIKRLAQDGISQFERDTEAQWEGEAHELLSRINPNYYRNANEALKQTEPAK